MDGPTLGEILGSRRRTYTTSMIYYALGCCITRGVACYKQFYVRGAALLIFYVDFSEPSMEDIYILRIEGTCLHTC